MHAITENERTIDTLSLVPLSIYVQNVYIWCVCLFKQVKEILSQVVPIVSLFEGNIFIYIMNHEINKLTLYAWFVPYSFTLFVSVARYVFVCCCYCHHLRRRCRLALCQSARLAIIRTYLYFALTNFQNNLLPLIRKCFLPNKKNLAFYLIYFICCVCACARNASFHVI